MRPATSCQSCRYVAEAPTVHYSVGILCHGQIQLINSRSHRRKCRLASSHGPCLRCIHLDLKCSLVGRSSYHVISARGVLPPSPRPLRQKSDSPLISSEEHDKGTLLPPYRLRRELVLLYFQHVHDKHHSLFHQPSVEVELENGQVPEVLLYAMMSLGAR